MNNYSNFFLISVVGRLCISRCSRWTIFVYIRNGFHLFRIITGKISFLDHHKPPRIFCFFLFVKQPKNINNDKNSSFGKLTYHASPSKCILHTDTNRYVLRPRQREWSHLKTLTFAGGPYRRFAFVVHLPAKIFLIQNYLMAAALPLILFSPMATVSCFYRHSDVVIVVVGCVAWQKG